MAKRKRAKSKRRGGLPPDKYLSDTQLRRLRQYVKDMADLARRRGSRRAVVDELIVELLANTGLRASELVALDIRDLPVSHGKPAVWVRDGKGKVARVVDVPESLQKRLERFVRLYRKRARPKSPLLVSTNGKRMIYRSIYEKCRKLGRLSGIGKLHPHMLRHTFAHMSKAGGASDEDLMALGGWRDHDMLRRYGASQAAARAHRFLSRNSRSYRRKASWLDKNTA